MRPVTSPANSTFAGKYPIQFFPSPRCQFNFMISILIIWTEIITYIYTIILGYLSFITELNFLNYCALQFLPVINYFQKIKTIIEIGFFWIYFNWYWLHFRNCFPWFCCFHQFSICNVTGGVNVFCCELVMITHNWS